MIELKEKASDGWPCPEGDGPACWAYDGPGSCRSCKSNLKIVAEERIEGQDTSSTNQPGFLGGPCAQRRGFPRGEKERIEV